MGRRLENEVRGPRRSGAIPWGLFRLGRTTLAPVLAAAGNITLRGVTLASKLVLTIAIARLLGPEDLGVYGLVVSAVALSVFALGFEYHYFTIRKLIPMNAIDRAAMIRDQVGLHVLTLAIALPAGIWLALGHGPQFLPARAIGWYLALVPVELIANELGVALVALERPLWSNAVLFLRSAAWVYVVVPLIALKADRAVGLDFLFGAWWVGACASVALAGYFLSDLGWRDAWRRRIDWRTLGEGLGVALPFIVTTGASLAMLFLDRFFIEHYLGLAAVGVFTFFASLTTGMHTLIYSGVSLLRMPRLVVAHRAEAASSFRRELLVMFGMTLAAVAGLALVLLLLIQPVLALAGRGVYENSLPVFYVLLVAAACRATADVPLYALYARHRDLVLASVNAAGLAAALTANLVLIPRMGLRGAASAALIGAAVMLGSATVASNLLPVAGSERRAE